MLTNAPRSRVNLETPFGGNNRFLIKSWIHLVSVSATQQPNQLRYVQIIMTSTDFILPQESLVLVTGVNGYIASHVVDQLLERGYRVRGTVRNAAKASWLQELYARRHGSGKFELASIPDYTKPEAFADVLKGA